MERNVWTSYCANGACVEVQWASPCSAGTCVEVTRQEDRVLVRDSKLGDASPVLLFTPDAWSNILATVPEGGLADGMYRAGGALRWVGRTSDGVAELSFDHREWAEFITGVRAGSFDLDGAA